MIWREILRREFRRLRICKGTIRIVNKENYYDKAYVQTKLTTSKNKVINYAIEKLFNNYPSIY